jgi:PBSX family phage terminase large subunit
MSSFFKIPIDKLLQRLPSPVEFNVGQQAMVDGLNEKRFWVHIAGRRTGKSYAAAILAFAKLLEPKQQVMVVAPNFSLSSIIWDYVTDLIKQLGIETEQYNQKDKVVKLVNGSIFRLLSANNRDSLVGRAANLLIIDEAAIIPTDEYFIRDLRPALSTFQDSRCLWISTPRGKGNYLYEYYLRGQDQQQNPEWGSAVYTWRSNPRLSEKDIMEAKRTMSRAMFLQEYECEWTTTEAQIYTGLDEDKHIGDFTGHAFSEIIAGLDVGYRDENVFVVIGISGNSYFILDEFISKESTTSELAATILNKIDEWRIDTIYIDSAAQQLKADFAYDYDIYCENAIKSVNDGINFLQSVIEQDNLYFDTSAAHTYSAMNAYKWNQSTDIPKPVHDWASHPCDAVRYAIYTHHKMSNISIYN